MSVTRRRDRRKLSADKETSQTRGYCVAKSATLRAARPDPSLRKDGLLGMTIVSWAGMRCGRRARRTAYAGRAGDIGVGSARCAWSPAGAGIGRRRRGLRALGDGLLAYGMLFGVADGFGYLILFESKRVLKEHFDG